MRAGKNKKNHLTNFKTISKTTETGGSGSRNLV